MISLSLFITWIVLCMCRVPFSISIGMGVLVALIISGQPLDVIPRMMVDSVNSFELLAVPFFVVAGNLCNAVNLTERLFAFARALVGRIPGGLAQVSIVAEMIFSGISGAALADIAGLGPIQLQAMRKAGYPEDFSIALMITSTCALGPIIPPSIMLVVYGIATNTSVGRLLLGGIIPGALIAVSIMFFVYLWVKIKKTTWGQPEPFHFKEVWKTFKMGSLSLLAPIIILGALITGKATPTDVGALATAYTLFFGLYYRELKWETLRPCLIESMSTTALIMYMVAVSTVMGWILTSERIPHEAAQIITGYIKSPFWGLMVINGFLLIVGMLMETLPSLLILSPILFPVVKMYGVDPVHFGLIICFNLGIGIITPPVGVGLFVAAKVAKVSPERISMAVLPFYIPLIISLIIVTYWPQLTLWLPNLVLGGRP